MTSVHSLAVIDGNKGTLNAGIITARVSPQSRGSDYATGVSVILNDSDAPSGAAHNNAPANFQLAARTDSAISLGAVTANSTANKCQEGLNPHVGIRRQSPRSSDFIGASGRRRIPLLVFNNVVNSGKMILGEAEQLEALR